MLWNLFRAVIAAGIIVAVAEIADRFPRLGALLLTLPIVSILAFVMAWSQHGELPIISRLARETLILVPLGLPFFVPLAYAEKLGLGFWAAFSAGFVLATATIGIWFAFGPQRL